MITATPTDTVLGAGSWDQRDTRLLAIIGSTGNEVLYGTMGNDVLVAGVGNDILYGSAGDDLYVFNYPLAA